MHNIADLPAKVHHSSRRFAVEVVLLLGVGVGVQAGAVVCITRVHPAEPAASMCPLADKAAEKAQAQAVPSIA